jgi:HSP20 family molecular chaperone IbpA
MNEVDADGAGLLSVLARLVTALEPSHDGDPMIEERWGAAPERWEDNNYVYVEANLAGASEAEIDISIHSGLVFIRIVR